MFGVWHHTFLRTFLPGVRKRFRTPELAHGGIILPSCLALLCYPLTVRIWRCSTSFVWPQQVKSRKGFYFWSVPHKLYIGPTCMASSVPLLIFFALLKIGDLDTGTKIAVSINHIAINLHSMPIRLNQTQIILITSVPHKWPGDLTVCISVALSAAIGCSEPVPSRSPRSIHHLNRIWDRL
jgi:hypothetical protein